MEDPGRRFVHRKTPFSVSTFNVRTLSSIQKKHEFLAQHHSIDVICLQEHRVHHPHVLDQEKINSHTLITASAEKSSTNSTIRRVGFLLSPRALKTCHNITKDTERIIAMTLVGNPETTVIGCYSPTNEDRNEPDVGNFYKDLSCCFSRPSTQHANHRRRFQCTAWT